MTILFGNLGDGRAMRAFGAVAAVATLGAIATGAEAERYARTHRAVLFLTSIPNTEVDAPSQLRFNGVDYAATGSLEPGGQRALVVLGTCSDIFGPALKTTSRKQGRSLRRRPFLSVMALAVRKGRGSSSLRGSFVHRRHIAFEFDKGGKTNHQA
jgi:hypothetical protein